MSYGSLLKCLTFQLSTIGIQALFVLTEEIYNSYKVVTLTEASIINYQS